METKKELKEQFEKQKTALKTAYKKEIRKNKNTKKQNNVFSPRENNSTPASRFMWRLTQFVAVCGGMALMLMSGFYAILQGGFQEHHRYIFMCGALVVGMILGLIGFIKVVLKLMLKTENKDLKENIENDLENNV